MASSLRGKRVVVVGASAGIGRACAVRALAADARVIVVARRADVLDELVAQAGGGTAVAADVCDAASRARLADAAGATLGQIDLVVYTVGFAQLRALAESDVALWYDTLDANVVAFNQLVRLLAPRMAPRGVVAVLSSETAAVPRSGLVHYAAAKAALEASVRGWRVEQPDVRFTCVVVGATHPTDFGLSFSAAELRPAFDDWVRHGLMQEELMHTDDVAEVIVDTLAAALAHPGLGVEQLVLRSSSSVMRSSKGGAHHPSAAGP
jgi:NAD(P)-dependent dehydrogenase (short-subunit alcohol dehydrogenase family)